MKFLKTNHPLLKRISKEISPDEINSKEIKNIIQKMLKIANVEQKNKKRPIMVGLAAPQIGISKRIILVDTKANGKGLVGKMNKFSSSTIKVYINPGIIWKSKREVEWYEGCFSIPGVCGIVKRSQSIKIKALGISGELIEEKHKEYIARIFQHEIDHLNGILFPSHIKNPDHLHKVLPSEFARYRDKEAWRNWPKKANL